MNIDNIVSMVTAVAVAYVAWQSARTNKLAKKTQEDMAIVEKATNSMKDALVAETSRRATAEGTATGLAQGRQEAQAQREQARSDEMDRHRLEGRP